MFNYKNQKGAIAIDFWFSTKLLRSALTPFWPSIDYVIFSSNFHQYLASHGSLRRTRLGRVAEANYVISAFCPRQTRKSMRIIVPFVLTAGVS